MTRTVNGRKKPSGITNPCAFAERCHRIIYGWKAKYKGSNNKAQRQWGCTLGSVRYVSSNEADAIDSRLRVTEFHRCGRTRECIGNDTFLEVEGGGTANVERSLSQFPNPKGVAVDELVARGAWMWQCSSES